MGRRRGESQKDVGCFQQRTISEGYKENGKADNIILIDIDSDNNIHNVITFNVAESLKQKLPGLTVLGRGGRCPVPIIICIHEEDEISAKEQPSDASSSDKFPPSPNQTRISTGADDDDFQSLHEILSLLRKSKCKRTNRAKAPSRSRNGLALNLDGDSSDKGQFDSDYTESTLGEIKAQEEKAKKLKKDSSGKKADIEQEKENRNGGHSKEQGHLYPGKISHKETAKPNLAGAGKSRYNPEFHNETPFANSNMKSTHERKGKQNPRWVSKDRPGSDFGDEIRSYGASADNENIVFEEPLFRDYTSKDEQRAGDDLARNNVEAGGEYVRSGQPGTSDTRHKEEVKKGNKTGKMSYKETGKSHVPNPDMKSTQERKGKQTARWVRISRDKESAVPDFSHSEETLDGLRSHCCPSAEKENLVSEEPSFPTSKHIGGESETRVSDELAGDDVEPAFDKCTDKYFPTCERTEDPLANSGIEELRKKSAGKCPIWGMPNLKEGEEQFQEKVEPVLEKPSAGKKHSCNEAETKLEGVAQKEDNVKFPQPNTSGAQQTVEVKIENKTGKLSQDQVHLNPSKVSYKRNNKPHFAGVEKSRCNPAFHNKTSNANSNMKSAQETKGKQTARWVRVSRDKETPAPDLRAEEDQCQEQVKTFPKKPYSVHKIPCNEAETELEGAAHQEGKDGKLLDEAGGKMNPVQDCLINMREKHKETDEYKRAEEEEWASRNNALRLQAEEAKKKRQVLERMKAESLHKAEMERREKQRLRDCLINIREKHKESDEYKQAEEEEWASRQHTLRLQAEEAKKARQVLKRMKAEKLRKIEIERRQKQRVEEIRETQKKDEENMNMKEKLRAEVRLELEELETNSLDMGSLLRGLGVPVSGGLDPQPHQIHGAYKKALLSFHPDRAATSDIRKLVEAEEKFKLVSRLKEKFIPTP